MLLKMSVEGLMKNILNKILETPAIGFIPSCSVYLPLEVHFENLMQDLPKKWDRLLFGEPELSLITQSFQFTEIN